MKKLDFIWAIILFVILAVGISLANGAVVWLFVVAMIGHLVTTISKVGRKQKKIENNKK